MPSPRGREYEVHVEFRAPLAFAYRWCTDYSNDDPALEGSDGARRVLERSERRVVYEDLEATPTGWMWSHWTVRLAPPDRWHGEARGNYRSWSLDYRLSALGPARTAFRLKGRRTPMLLGTVNPPKARLERELTVMWKRLGRALEADYRKSVRGRRGPSRTRR